MASPNELKIKIDQELVAEINRFARKVAKLQEDLDTARQLARGMTGLLIQIKEAHPSVDLEQLKPEARNYADALAEIDRLNQQAEEDRTMIEMLSKRVAELEKQITDLLEED